MSRKEVECLFGYHKFDELWDVDGKYFGNLRVCSICRRVGDYNVFDSLTRHFLKLRVDIIEETPRTFRIKPFDSTLILMKCPNGKLVSVHTKVGEEGKRGNVKE